MPSAPATSITPLPLTQTQSDIWLEQSLHPESGQFTICTYYEMDFALDANRFADAANLVFSQYDALYARLEKSPDGVPVMRYDPANAVLCERVDLRQAADPGAAAAEFYRDYPRQRFDLEGGPLVRMALIRYGEQRYSFFICFHHIIVDGWATGIVITRIAEAYESLRDGVRPEPKGQSFAQCLETLGAPLAPAAHAKAVEFWKNAFSRPDSEPAPRHRLAPGAMEMETRMTSMILPRALANQVSEMAAKCGGTLYHALALTLVHVTAKTLNLDPVYTELPVLNRGKEDKETIGIFVEPRKLPLPVQADHTIAENIAAVAKRVRELFRHYRLPQHEIRKIYHDCCHNAYPSHDIVLSYITRDYGGWIDGHFVPMIIYPQSNQDNLLTLYVLDTYPEKDITINLLYQTRIFDAEETSRFAGRFLNTLRQFSDDPQKKLADVDILPDGERRLIDSMLTRGNPADFRQRPVIFDILDNARHTPEAIAVEDGSRHVTYRECLAKASSIARELVEVHKVGSGDVVPILLPRSAELIESQLAVLMTGAAFTPMEIANPPLRLAQIAEDCAPKCVITSAGLDGKASSVSPQRLIAENFPAADAFFDPLARPDDIAYVIYTSGSTGRPKGVEIPHKALAAHLASSQKEIPQANWGEKALFFHSPSFDASIDAIYGVLARGNTIVPAPHPQWTVYEIGPQIVAKGITLLFLPPAYMMELLKHLEQNPGEIRGHKVRRAIVGGDILHADTAPLWDKVFGPQARIANIYGPTEITVSVTSFSPPFGYKADLNESIPIGHVYEGRFLRILDPSGRDVPIGVEGELYLGGIGLAKGYRNLPDETAKRFLTLPDGKRYYRSGDIAVLRGDGEIIFRRRADTQIKVRGYRVETSEIEACLNAEPTVRECAVIAIKDELTGECELRAFASLKQNATSDVSELRSYLEARLPHYMVPRIALMESLPKTDSGKIDRKSLKTCDIAPEIPTATGAPNAPEGVVQEYLAHLWEESLGSKVTDTRKDFFELGGHSLLAAKLVATLSKAFRVDYPFPAFFDHSSIADTECKLEALVGGRAKLDKIAAVRLELARLTPEEIQARLKQLKTGV